MPNIALPKAVKPLGFFREVTDELKKVVWPTKDETVRLTGIVIGISIIVALYIGAADYIFTLLLGLIIKR
ncbi:MAG: preprotein translocase subunit SecE [Patescibacteria group bacterium]|nr:preprotein translocase subunit SecE [Patescibacteria group bacterium]